MIDMAAKTVDGKPILRFEVWFRTIQGLHKTLDDALTWAAAEELPAHMIQAVPVAVADGYYEEKK